MFGYVMNNELININNVIKEGKKPITAILGGLKFQVNRDNQQFN